MSRKQAIMSLKDKIKQAGKSVRKGEEESPDHGVGLIIQLMMKRKKKKEEGSSIAPPQEVVGDH